MRALRNSFHLGAVALMVVGAALCAGARHEMTHTSSAFQGKKVNGGTVTHYREGNQSILRLSDDFQIPDTPDPHWQVIDSKGESHLLQGLKVKKGLSNREIILPNHVPDVVIDSQLDKLNQEIALVQAEMLDQNCEQIDVEQVVMFPNPSS